MREERGFTLIELLVAMPMLVILLAGLSLTLIQLMRSSGQTQQLTTLQTEARSTLATLQTDIRQAFSGDGTPPIVTATATSITFQSPDRSPTTTSGSSQSSFHLRKIVYSLSGGTLSRQFMTSTNVFPTAPPWTWPGSYSTLVPVISSVTNTDVFSYYTVAGAQAVPPTALGFPIADTTGVEAIGVKLSLSTGGTQPKIFTFNETIALRETDT
jgi:prepilin-type N-terminal cleavage/methylation domain-containing protein